jgi:hypothetical protein
LNFMTDHISSGRQISSVESLPRVISHVAFIHLQGFAL